METNYKEELIKRFHQVGLSNEDATNNEVRDMLSKHPDIYSISYEVSYERTDEKAPEGFCTALAYIKDVVVVTGRAKCENCDEYYLKTREWSKFCSDKCRQAAYRSHPIQNKESPIGVDEKLFDLEGNLITRHSDHIQNNQSKIRDCMVGVDPIFDLEGKSNKTEEPSGARGYWLWQELK